MTARCGWLWLHGPLPGLREDTGRPHGCARPHAHPGACMCWCGARIGRAA